MTGRAITLGVHVGHDAAVAIFVDGALVFAEEEERHTRKKAQGGCPWRAIAAALEAAHASADEVQCVALTWNLERYLRCRAELAEHARSVGNTGWFDKRQREIAIVHEAVDELRARFPHAELLDFAHHHAHIACAAYFAPADASEAEGGSILGVVADALGDAESITVFTARDRLAMLTRPDIVLRRGPEQSVGFFYKRASEAFGFAGSEACGYLMALSGCGDAGRYASLLREHLLRVGDDDFFEFAPGFDPVRGHSETAERCFPDELIAALDLDRSLDDGNLLARAAQAAACQRLTEDYLEQLLRSLVATHQPRRVLVSGGVFLNCVALERLARCIDVAITVCPVKRDSGTAIGAAVLADVSRNGARVLATPRRTLRLGTTVTGREPVWTAQSGRYDALAPDDLVHHLADDVIAGHLVGLVDGPGEFGPRALGARSILAHADRPTLAAHTNTRVKSRHAFQPFAGAFMAEDLRTRAPTAAADDSMSFAVRFESNAARAGIAGLLHRDGSCRVQRVDSEDSILRQLLEELSMRGEPAVVLNTSLNARGEPMPRTAEDAVATCAGLGLSRVYTPTGRWQR